MGKAILDVEEADKIALSEIGEWELDQIPAVTNPAGHSDHLADVLTHSLPGHDQPYRQQDHFHFINLTQLNRLRYINKFFERVNDQLSVKDHFVGCFECKDQRKQKLFDRYSPLLAYPLYLLDFIWNRLFPKVSFLYRIYYACSRQYNRTLTVSEVLGRLISCGFKICNYYSVEGKTYFCVEKEKMPSFDRNPTYGPLITLDRVGMHGELIRVYKFRTMHPYSEYLQQYVYQQNKLQEGGKFYDDFRISNWGKLMRKLWLDEMPMIWNWLKGEVKLVGVRPISQHYFQLYPRSFRERRIRYRPGLIPPFYAHMPKTFEEIVASERKYLMEYDKHPLLTDIRYLVAALYNILVRRARSH